MKKIKLFALAIMAMLSTNVFAATDAYAVKDGVWYRYVSDGSAGVGTQASPYQATVFAVKENEEGVETLTIPAKFTWVSPTEDDMYFVVVGFEANWDSMGDMDVNGDGNAESFEAITFQLTSLTVNIDNFTTAAIANLVGGLKKLTSLTLIDEAKTGTGWTPTVHTVANLGITDVIKGKLTTLNIGRTGITIEDDAFKAETYTKLTSITLPEELVTIGKSAFKGFKGTAITFPNTVTTIDESAFEGAALTGVTFNTIASGANAGKVVLTSIGEKAFKGCTALASISVPGATGALTIDDNAFEGCTALATATLGSAATIDDNAFKGCTSLAEVTIPGISTIGASAFEGCTSLATVTISGATTSIGADAFKGCTSLESIDLSKTNLGDNLGAAFSGCTALTAVTLNDKVTKLVNDLFKDTKIEEINAPGTVDVGTIMGAPTTDAPNTTLKKVTLGKLVDAKPLITLTFQNCTALEEVTLGFNDAWTIPAEMVAEKCFLNCTALTTFNFSPTDAVAKYVNDKAFLGCSSSPLVHFVTSTIYQTTFPNAPYQTTYGNEAATTVTTKADKGTSGKFFAKYHATSKVSINPDDAKVYSVYVDEGTAFFQALVKRGGVYVLFANDNVIIKTDEEKEVELTPYNGFGASSVLIDDIYCPAAATTLTALQDAGTINPGEYLYRLTNNAASGGFGFTYYTKSDIAAGQFFIVSDLAPAAGRLNIVWLDEDGNVESDATAINGIVKKAQNDGVIYNLAGQKVNASYKGVVIKDGKKMIMK